MKESKRKEEREVKMRGWKGKGRKMKGKQGGHFREEGSAMGRDRKGLYSQERHSRLHEMALLIQERAFSCLSAKSQSSFILCLWGLTLSSWPHCCSPCKASSPPFLRITTSAFLAQKCGRSLLFSHRHSQLGLTITYILWSMRLY